MSFGAWRAVVWGLPAAWSACIAPGAEDGDATLTLTIRQERAVYEASDWGEPPQWAVWLEDPQTGAVRTVCVTYRTATGDFAGKMECPVALPAWIAVFRAENDRDDLPAPGRPAAAVVTGATPQTAEFTRETAVPRGSTWRYYVEVNVSGDFNATFPAVLDDGTPDTQGNGQPSIIYRGTITADPGAQSTPELIGRTEQFFFSSTVNPDLTGIESARNLFSRITVTCR